MPIIDVDKLLASLDQEISIIVSDFVKKRRNEYEEKLRSMRNNLGDDLKRYTALLANQHLTPREFEQLVQGRWTELQIEVLTAASVSRSKFSHMARRLLEVIVRTTITAMII